MKLDRTISAIVTGGASGLGAATARALAAVDVKVAIFDLNSEKGEAVAREIGGTFCQADLTSGAAADEAFARARAAHGQERVMINCAGGGVPGKTIRQNKETGKFEALSLETFTKVIHINLISAFQCTAKSAAGMASLERLDRGERGVIVNTASIAAVEGQIGQVAYAAAKAAIVGMTLPIARDLSPEGIRVMTILPGIFDTPPMQATPAPVKEQLYAAVPFPKRFGDPPEYASLILEICRNGYLNGEAIRLDGAIRMPPR
jgi:NAD(P)-dependent dehydrogenase (short-subunit alcohol dehydrogenase family)